MAVPTVTNTPDELHGQAIAIKRDLPHRINVKSYGATGDGTTDDTNAIRNAIAALPASRGSLFFPAGTYIVDLNDPTLVNTQLGAILPFTTINTRIYGEGPSSIIKVKNGASRYTTIIGGANFSTTDLSGLYIHDLAFDHNIDNNNITNYATINFQHTIRVGIGTRVRIRNLDIYNSSSVNNITVNGSNVTDVLIADCYFYNNGDDPNHVNHDVSVIYTHATRVRILNNIIVSSGVDDGGATTGIETHGSDTIVHGNTIVNYLTGMNITGVEEEDSTEIVISNNTLSGCNLGINLWSLGYLAHVTGFGLDNVRVCNNQISLNGVDAWPTKNTGHYTAGITIYPNGAGQLDVNAIVIEQNTITHPLESSPITGNSISIGIGMYSSTNKTIYNSSIKNNTIVNFPFAGIRFSCHLNNVDIIGNQLINCGSTLDAAVAGAAGYRFPMMIAPITAFRLNINHNTFTDSLTDVTFRPAYFIGLFQSVCVGAGRVNMIENVYISTGSAMTGQITMENSGTDLTPYMRGSVSGLVTAAISGAGRTWALGSQIIDISNGKVYTIDSDQITWVDGLLASGLTTGLKRLQSKGTTLVNADFAISAGWGATAAITAVQGSDSAFFVRVTANGAGLAANATITLTFKDGAYAAAPIIVGMLSNVTGDPGATAVTHLFTTNTTFCTIVLTTLPVAAAVYTFTCVIVARP